MSAISTFTFHEYHNVRVQVIYGEPWFCLPDVCNILDIQNSRQIVQKQLDQKGVCKIYTLTNGGNQQLTFINEPNLYRVIFRSNKPEAKQFQDWVFNEVLPSIRKTGGYHTAQTPPIRSEKPQYLEHKDMQNIRDLVWQCSRVFGNEDAVGRAVWHAIRQVTGVPSPDKFQTQHLKPMAEEFLRILGVVESYTDLRRQTERDIIKQIIRERGDSYQMKQIFMDLEDFSAKRNGELRKAISLMFKQKCQRLIDRQ